MIRRDVGDVLAIFKRSQEFETKKWVQGELERLDKLSQTQRGDIDALKATLSDMDEMIIYMATIMTVCANLNLMGNSGDGKAIQFGDIENLKPDTPIN